MCGSGRCGLVDTCRPIITEQLLVASQAQEYSNPAHHVSRFCSTSYLCYAIALYDINCSCISYGYETVHIHQEALGVVYIMDRAQGLSVDESLLRRQGVQVMPFTITVVCHLVYSTT